MNRVVLLLLCGASARPPRENATAPCPASEAHALWVVPDDAAGSAVPAWVGRLVARRRLLGGLDAEHLVEVEIVILDHVHAVLYGLTAHAGGGSEALWVSTPGALRAGKKNTFFLIFSASSEKRNCVSYCLHLQRVFFSPRTEFLSVHSRLWSVRVSDPVWSLCVWVLLCL